MGWNGTGLWVRLYSWVTDKQNGIDITASRMDADTNDITGNGLGNALTRDGQGSATALLPMNGYRHTGVGNAVDLTDYAAFGQVQNRTSFYGGVSTGAANVFTISLTPAITVYAIGQEFEFYAHQFNSGVAPVVNVNGIGAIPIVKLTDGGIQLLAADDIAINQLTRLAYDTGGGGQAILLNPANAPSGGSAALASAGTVPIGVAAAVLVAIGGITTITAFDVIAAGTIRVLLFSGALLLTHNPTTLILPGEASITTAPGDVAIMISLGGGSWQCISYTTASGKAVVQPQSGPGYATIVGLANA